MNNPSFGVFVKEKLFENIDVWSSYFLTLCSLDARCLYHVILGT